MLQKQIIQKRHHYLYRVLALVLAVMLALAGSLCAYAEEEKSEEEKQKEFLESIYKKEVASNKISGWPKGPGTYGEAACVMDMDSGAILYDKFMNAKNYPASITKVLTAYVTCKYGDLNAQVKMYREDLSFLEPGDAALGMLTGEVMTMNDAMHAMLLHSANEISHAIIRTVGQKVRKEGKIKVPGAPEKAKSEVELDYQWGIALMNMEAKALGCTGSHFVNSYGLHDKDHYVTAHDMCLIGAAAYQYDYFRKVTQTLYYKIPRYAIVEKKGDKETKKPNKNGLYTVEPREFKQNHKMLYKDHEMYYNKCTGGKTGFTDQAGTTLVTFAESGGRRLVCTCLHTYGAGNVYKDTRALMEYGFNKFENKELSLNDLAEITNKRGSGRKITMVNEETLKLTVPKGVGLDKVSARTLFDPENINLNSGIIRFSVDSMPVGEVKASFESLHATVRQALSKARQRFGATMSTAPGE